MTKNQLYERVIQEIINHTRLTKVSPHSVVSGLAQGIASVAQKALVDIALISSRLFPREASGQRLDLIAQDWGIPGRFGPVGSRAYLRVTATPGTTYVPGIIVTGNHGINFTIDRGFIVGDNGFVYVRCSSVDTGQATNVASLSLNRMINPPTGHLSCINEFMASGGSDQESDIAFADRIINYYNSTSRHTLSFLEQIAIATNDNVYRLVSRGLQSSGKIAIGVITRNGANLSNNDLSQLLNGVAPYLSLREMQLNYGGNFGIQFVNVRYFPVNIAFRVRLRSGANPDNARRAIQLALSAYFTPDRWERSNVRIEWDDLLEIVKQASPNDIDYVPDQFFFPQVDIDVPYGQIPQIASFIMADISGSIIADLTGTFPTNYQYSPLVDEVFLHNIAFSAIE